VKIIAAAAGVSASVDVKIVDPSLDTSERKLKTKRCGSAPLASR
jgi:hypothetical protein